jgi:hypothetical protein
MPARAASRGTALLSALDAGVAPQDLLSVGAQRARCDIDGYWHFVARQTAPTVATDQRLDLRCIDPRPK